MAVGAPTGSEPKDTRPPDVTIEREIAEVIRGSYARVRSPPAKRRIGPASCSRKCSTRTAFIAGTRISWMYRRAGLPGPAAEAREASGETRP